MLAKKKIMVCSFNKEMKMRASALLLSSQMALYCNLLLESICLLLGVAFTSCLFSFVCSLEAAFICLFVCYSQHKCRLMLQRVRTQLQPQCALSFFVVASNSFLASSYCFGVAYTYCLCSSVCCHQHMHRTPAIARQDLLVVLALAAQMKAFKQQTTKNHLATNLECSIACLHFHRCRCTIVFFITRVHFLFFLSFCSFFCYSTQQFSSLLSCSSLFFPWLFSSFEGLASEQWQSLKGE